MIDLYSPLADEVISLVPMIEAHREPLRAACSEDTEIWEIYPFSYLGEAFDPQFDLMLRHDRPRLCYAIIVEGEVIGMTAWIEHGAPGWSVEVGNSYIVPRLRGTGINGRLKRLMLDHAVRNGYRRIAFKVDAINTRSRAAVLKLGCTQEGIMRSERLTWTGRTRDTVLFSMLDSEWRAIREKEGVTL